MLRLLQRQLSAACCPQHPAACLCPRMNHLPSLQPRSFPWSLPRWARVGGEIMMRPSDAFWAKAAKAEVVSVLPCSWRQAGGTCCNTPIKKQSAGSDLQGLSALVATCAQSAPALFSAFPSSSQPLQPPTRRPPGIATHPVQSWSWGTVPAACLHPLPAREAACQCEAFRCAPTSAGALGRFVLPALQRQQTHGRRLTVAKPVPGSGLSGWVRSCAKPTTPVRRKIMELCAGLPPPASEGRQRGWFSHFWGVSLAAWSLRRCTAAPTIQTLPHHDGQRH